MSEKTITLDFDLILQSLGFAKKNYESTQYPSYEEKQKHIQRVEKAIAQVKELRDQEIA